MRLLFSPSEHASYKLRRTIAGVGLIAALVGGGGIAFTDTAIADTAAAHNDPPTREEREPRDRAERQAKAEEREAKAAERQAKRDAHVAEHDAAREALALLFDLTVDDMRASLRAGSSLADLADAAGVDKQQIIDHLVDAATTQLDERVAAGQLTEDQAAARADKVTERAEALVDGEHSRRGATRRGDRPARSHRLQRGPRGGR